MSLNFSRRFKRLLFKEAKFKGRVVSFALTLIALLPKKEKKEKKKDENNGVTFFFFLFQVSSGGAE